MIKKALLALSLIGLLLLASFFAAPTTLISVSRADCLGPNPTATTQPPYSQKVLNTQSGHLLAYWKLDETSGTTANDASGHSRTGTYSGPTLSGTTFLNGDPAPSFDGVNDNVNLYTSSLNSAFNGQSGTVLAWAEVHDALTWSDGAAREIYRFGDGGGQYSRGRKATTTNQLQIYYLGTTKSQTSSVTNWFQIGETWNFSGNVAKAFYAGAQVSTDITGFAAWSGSLGTTSVILGDFSTSAANPWYGSISNVALWDTALNTTEVALLATVDPVLPTATPYPTCTPTPTYTPTITPSWTPTITPHAQQYADAFQHAQRHDVLDTPSARHDWDA